MVCYLNWVHFSHLDNGFSFGFSVQASMMLCHPDAKKYRDNFKTHKEELTTILYKMYNEKAFGGKLDIDLIWNKKLTTTAGRFIGRTKCVFYIFFHIFHWSWCTNSKLQIGKSDWEEKSHRIKWKGVNKCRSTSMHSNSWDVPCSNLDFP